MPQKLTLNSLIDALRSQYAAEKDRICQEELQILGKKKIIEYQGGYPLLEQELTRHKYAGEGMSAGLYEPDADEARIADAIADMSFAQLKAVPALTADYPASSEEPLAFVMGVYTMAAILLRDKYSEKDFDRLFRHARENYNINLTSRAVRRLYDRNWPGKYRKETNFYPLGQPR